MRSTCDYRRAKISFTLEINDITYDLHDIYEEYLVRKKTLFYALILKIELENPTFISGREEQNQFEASLIEQLEQTRVVCGDSFKTDAPPPTPTPKCPTCGSTNIEALGTGTRIAAGAMFGLFSKTAGCQFVCKSCGYKW